MKQPFRLLILVAICAAVGAYFVVGSLGFTKWMTLAELNAFMDTFKAEVPGQPNYWDKGHWINAVEGRWHDGVPQYRIRYGDAPKNQGYWWYWFINQDEKSFNAKIHEYAEDGFALVSFNKMILPDGTPRYQGVWHKYGKEKNVGQTAEAGH